MMASSVDGLNLGSQTQHSSYMGAISYQFCFFLIPSLYLIERTASVILIQGDILLGRTRLNSIKQTSSCILGDLLVLIQLSLSLFGGLMSKGSDSWIRQLPRVTSLFQITPSLSVLAYPALLVGILRAFQLLPTS